MPGLAPPVKESEIVMRVCLLRGRGAIENGLKVDFRVGEAARFHLRHTSVVSRFDERAIETKRVRERPQGARVLLLEKQREAECIRNVRIPGRARARPYEGLNGLIGAAFTQHREPAPVVDEVRKDRVLLWG